MKKRLMLVSAIVLVAVLIGAAAFHMTGKSGGAAGLREETAEALYTAESGSGTEAVPEAGTEDGTEAVPEAGTEDGAEAVPETGTEDGAEAVPEAGTENGTEAGTETSASEAADSGEADRSSKASYYGALRVNGTQLVDADGSPVQLRGISTHGLAWFPEYVNEEMIRQLHEEWNANVIRLAMYTAESGGYCTGGNQARLKQLVKDGVQYATDAGMYVIIDWHILSDGNPNQYKSEAKDFFEEMSQTFASYENVLYEICNEPNGGTAWSDVKAYAEEIIPVIRQNAPDAVILVGTPNWCQYVDQAAADPLTGGGNLMYTLHFYAATHTDALRNTMVSAIGAGLPVFVSEYGICDASGSGGIDEKQANSWVSLMNEYGISYVVWSLSNKNETASIIDSSCAKTSGLTEEDLSASGKWVYHMLTGGNGGMAAHRTPGDSGGTGKPDAPSSLNPPSDAPAGGGAVLTNEDLEITPALTGSWESNGQHFYQYAIALTNCSGKAGSAWEIDVNFSQDFSLSDKWNGNYTVDGPVLHITSLDYNGNLAAGASTGDIGFIVSGSAELELQQPAP